MEYNKRKQEDIDKGIEKEKTIFETVKEKWNIKKLIKTSQYHELDFIDENKRYYEIKSRNNNYDKYETTMVGYNKIEFIKKNNVECIFIFLFLDGYYFYEYDKEDNFVIKKGGRKDRGKLEYKDYYHIPIEKLNKLEI